jgi:hypothetical protein
LGSGAESLDSGFVFQLEVLRVAVVFKGGVAIDILVIGRERIKVIGEGIEVESGLAPDCLIVGVASK